MGYPTITLNNANVFFKGVGKYNIHIFRHDLGYYVAQVREVNAPSTSNRPTEYTDKKLIDLCYKVLNILID